jgi:hypothetical protein
LVCQIECSRNSIAALTQRDLVRTRHNKSDLPFKKYFYHKQKHNKKGKPNQNFEIPFVEYFVQFGIFSISINHCDYKNNSKKTGKQHLTLTKHSIIFWANLGICLRKVTNLPTHLIKYNYAKTNQRSQRVSYGFQNWSQ